MPDAALYLSHDLLRQNRIDGVNPGDVIDITIPSFGIDATYRVEEIAPAGVHFVVPA